MCIMEVSTVCVSWRLVLCVYHGGYYCVCIMEVSTVCVSWRLVLCVYHGG